ncbi:uncharacterized protein EMH_0029350 [Eimeria mitis]|uniref:Uncharacterized protein n=1 Tax=Eimeria mitis TaxID=44415 RepID=U6KGZ8_9EIME|nr:uncharacterized protein EMH_0029350 [Eimeria mitis]CDJ36056.1 hypothetical protein, conserved [Eimeria mitis]
MQQYASCKSRAAGLLLWLQALRRLSAHAREEATGRAVALLRSIPSTGIAPWRDGDQEKPAPFVIAISRPLQRLALRELLGCDTNFSDSIQQRADPALDATGNKETMDVVKGTAETSWRQLCASTNIGLEKLRSGAVLLTLELPSAVHDRGNDRLSNSEHGTVSARYTQEPRASDAAPAGNPVAGYRTTAAKKEASDYTDPLGDLSESVCALTEAAMVRAIALTLVEAADVLVVPLSYDGLVSVPRSHDHWKGNEYGELLCLGGITPGEEGGPTATRDNGRVRQECQPPLRTEPKPAHAHVRLPEDVLQLLQAMRQLINAEIFQEEASSSTRQSRIRPNKSTGPVSLGTNRPRRLPLFVIALEVISTARVGVFGMHSPERGKDTRDEIDHLIQGIEPRNASVKQIADALAALLTREHVSGPPNAFEFPGYALSSNVCGAAFRLSLAHARLSLQRRALREELRRSVEREIRTIFLRWALQIESNLRLSLRAELVAALQRDARRFESLTPGIIRKALTTLDERLALLLPHAPGVTDQQPVESLLGSRETPPGLLEQTDVAKISDASAKAARDRQLCRKFYHSLVEIHLLLLQKAARDFSAMATELSRSPLAALLRQQHGYSRYNTGPVQFLFGFTNDSEGLESGRNAAFRLQPKLHFDIEVD